LQAPFKKIQNILGIRSLFIHMVIRR